MDKAGAVVDLLSAKPGPRIGEGTANNVARMTFIVGHTSMFSSYICAFSSAFFDPSTRTYTGDHYD